jgi:hypothetical protein
MTTQQLYWFGCLYLAVFVVVALLTRATARRVAGALAGSAIVGVVGLGNFALGEKLGLWQFAISWEPYFLTLLLVVFTICGFIYLVTWRIARRFGWRGLAAVVIFAALIGPPRQYWYTTRFPEWGSYSPGIATVLAISATYVLMILLGHGVMRLVAGPSGGSPLARRPWESAEASAETRQLPYVDFWNFTFGRGGR